MRESSDEKLFYGGLPTNLDILVEALSDKMIRGLSIKRT